MVRKKTPKFESREQLTVPPPMPEDPPIQEEAESALPVEDLDSIEVVSQADSVKKDYELHGRDKIEVLKFPRDMLMAKFVSGAAGMLVLPQVVESEWFKKTLKRYGFTNDARFIKDSKGRFLLRHKEEDAYCVSQRV